MFEYLILILIHLDAYYCTNIMLQKKTSYQNPLIHKPFPRTHTHTCTKYHMYSIQGVPSDTRTYYSVYVLYRREFHPRPPLTLYRRVLIAPCTCAVLSVARSTDVRSSGTIDFSLIMFRNEGIILYQLQFKTILLSVEI